MRLRIFMGLAVLLCAPASAQELRTAGLLNGRAWLRLAPEAQNAYVAGFSDGHSAASPKSLPHFNSARLTIDEFAKLLDRFYGDVANVRIPIALALDLVAARAGGETPDEYQRDLASTRKDVAASS